MDIKLSAINSSLFVIQSPDFEIQFNPSNLSDFSSELNKFNSQIYHIVISSVDKIKDISLVYSTRSDLFEIHENVKIFASSNKVYSKIVQPYSSQKLINVFIKLIRIVSFYDDLKKLTHDSDCVLTILEENDNNLQFKYLIKLPFINLVLSSKFTWDPTTKKLDNGGISIFVHPDKLIISFVEIPIYNEDQYNLFLQLLTNLVDFNKRLISYELLFSELKNVDSSKLMFDLIN